jgi:hypothetical protein
MTEAPDFKQLKPQLFRSTIPHILAVFGAMDIVGYLISDAPNAEDTTGNILKFLETEITDSDTLKCLIFICRHGMGHSFFPKKRIAIKAHSSNPKSVLFFIDRDETLTLNADYLIEVFIKRFNEIILKTDDYEKMNEKFKELEESDDLKLGNPNKILSFDFEAFKSTLSKFD